MPEQDVTETLEQAWQLRVRLGAWQGTEALRVFYGPGECASRNPLRAVAIDQFGAHYWVTLWGTVGKGVLDAVAAFLSSKGARSAVVLLRPERGVPEPPKTLLGEPPTEPFTIHENGATFRIRFRDSRHPGLFLDHLPLRNWLRAHARGWKVLNTFAYTGSLSVAAGLAGASHVTTLDLSKPTIQWAEENWKANDLPGDRARFIAGDVFEWFPRLRKNLQADERYDAVILDPPSFARGHKGTFSTSKDLPRLHEQALDVLAPGGVLITSINSEDISFGKFEADIVKAARVKKVTLKVLARIELPETFPTPLGEPEARYLKGFILEVGK